MSEWISVKDQLPDVNKHPAEDYGWVAVIAASKYYVKEMFYKKTKIREYRDWETDRKSTRLNSSHSAKSRMPSSA